MYTSTFSPSASLGPTGRRKSRSQYGACSGELAVPGEEAPRGADVRVGLDRVDAYGPVRDDPVRGRPRDEHIVAVADLKVTEDRLHAGPAVLDVETLVADRVAVVRADRVGHHIRQPYVVVAQQQSAAGDRVDARRAVGEQLVRGEVAGDQGVIGGQGLVARLPHPVLPYRRRDVPVVEQRGVRGEALLTHEFLVVEVPVRVPVLGVAFRRDRSRPVVVRHVTLPCALSAQ